MQRVSHLRLPAFKATVMDAMPQLVELDSSATAGIILSSFPQEHAVAVRQLQGSPHLQYKYLRAALQVKFLCPCSRESLKTLYCWDSPPETVSSRPISRNPSMPEGCAASGVRLS